MTATIASGARSATYADAVRSAEAHRFEQRRLGADARARRALLAGDRCALGDDAARGRQRDAAAAAEALADVHASLADGDEAKAHRRGNLLQRNRAALQKAAIGLAVGSEIVTIPFFAVSIAQMIRKRRADPARILLHERGGVADAPGVAAS